jgi:hypothetical protein
MGMIVVNFPGGSYRQQTELSLTLAYILIFIVPFVCDNILDQN